ncbi:MAG: PilT/PilU family type 4a pilus ATPase [Firmicutes bacterium]|nr:PilT/PilU family type 4a pilus ATPase [Bacillota bacterium]
MRPDPDKTKKDDIDFRSFLSALTGEPSSVPRQAAPEEGRVPKAPVQRMAPPPQPQQQPQAQQPQQQPQRPAKPPQPQPQPQQKPQPQPKPAAVEPDEPDSGVELLTGEETELFERRKSAETSPGPDVREVRKEDREPQTDKIALSHIAVRASFTIEQLLETMIREKASDLHISVGSTPALRLNGEVVPLELPDLDPEMADELLLPILNEEQRVVFFEEGDIDFSFDYGKKARFRVNIFSHHKGIGAVFRYIPLEVPKLEQLGLPRVVLNLLRFKKGLLLVVGPTGHGKTTTLAAMINEVNKTRKKRIITMENPIEYVYKSDLGLISQREVGNNVNSYSEALWSVLREDPDVIMISELWDCEDVRQVLKISETGHLVIAAMQTLNCASAVERLVDMFPQEEHDQIRISVSESLIGVIAQRLIPRIDRQGRALAAEVLITTTGLAALIREGKMNQIPSIIQTGRDLGMCTMEHSVGELLDKNIISPADARGLQGEVRMIRPPGSRRF